MVGQAQRHRAADRAVLLIAQILQTLRMAVAERAEVDVFAVSMRLLIQYLPEYAVRYDDPIAEFVADGERMKFIRPARRVPIRAPSIPLDQMVWPPADLTLIQTPRYANRKCARTAAAK